MKIEIDTEKWKQAFRLGTVIIGWLLVIAVVLAFTFDVGARAMLFHLAGAP